MVEGNHRGDNGIEVEGLVREFKKGPRAVDGIDLTVAPGEIYGFLGPNGAGKSTTVHMLTTLLPPTAGTARVVAGEEELPSKPLAQVLEEHPRFAEPALLKLDTDGMDVPILLANLDLLRRVGPALLFEYDPDAGAVPEVFDRLREVGYERMLVYENTGELRRAGDVDAWPHDEYAGHGGRRYADVCVLRPSPVAAALEAAEQRLQAGSAA